MDFKTVNNKYFRLSNLKSGDVLLSKIQNSDQYEIDSSIISPNTPEIALRLFWCHALVTGLTKEVFG